MRFLAIFPLICAIGAFVLTMLCIFAGSNTGFLTDAEILTVNTSMVGEFVLNQTSSSGSSLYSALSGDISQIQGTIQGDLNEQIHSFAQALGIHDFYSAYVLDYCEGYYEPTPIANSTFSPSMNVTGCSNKTALFHFDPQAILQSELRTDVNFSDIHWPSQVNDAVTAIRISTTVMFICYCIAAGFAGIAIIGGFVAFFMDTRLADFVNFMLYFIAFIAAGIASAIATVLAVKITNAINQYGNQIGITAYVGNKFMIMTWIATGVLLVGSVIWIIDCCVPRARRREITYVKEGKEGRI